jgi:hypothetical protein
MAECYKLRACKKISITLVWKCMKVNRNTLKCEVYGSVWKCDEIYAVFMVWKCMELYKSVNKCMGSVWNLFYESERKCMGEGETFFSFVSLWQCMKVYCRIWQTVCGTVWKCMKFRLWKCTTLYMKVWQCMEKIESVRLMEPNPT